MDAKFPIGTKVRRLLNSDEVLNLSDLKISVEKKRITDPNFSFVIYEVIDVKKHCLDCLYYHVIKDLKTEKIYQHNLTYWHLEETHAL